jgi:glycerol-3-phosphate dehydrogenase
MLVRDVEGAASESWDVIILGGGVYGAMLSLEATARGLRPLLIERHDFGGQTSFNSFRLIHGGLRYLQSMDLIRLRESVAERRWFLRHFPEFIVRVPCIMPLYKRGLKRRDVFRIALWVNDILSCDRNSGLKPDQHLPAGRIAGRKEVLELCPGVATENLEGAALWWDASMPDSQRLLMEIFRWSAACGATALNYLQAENLLVANGEAAGIEALDTCSGQTHEFRGRLVINATGPWVRDVAAKLDRDHTRLFRPTIAWNILLDRPPPIDGMLVLHTDDSPSQTYFIQAFKKRLLVGTGHAGWDGGPDMIAPSSGQLGETLARVNKAMPGLDLESKAIMRVFSGLLPGRGSAGHKLASRPAIVDHGRKGGVKNLFSVSGVKFTTARHVAERVLDIAIGQAGEKRDLSTCQPSPVRPEDWSCNVIDSMALEKFMPGLRALVEREMVMHLDDLVFRRTSLWENRELVSAVAVKLCDLFTWDEKRRSTELKRLAAAFTPVVGSGQPSQL